MPTQKTSRVIGIGNLLMGDDGLGVVAIEKLRGQNLPSGIELIDGGCGGVTLLQILTECGRAIIIDAADFGKAPGSILRLPAEKIIGFENSSEQVSLHQTGLAEVLTLAQKLDQLPEVTLFLVQPQSVARCLELSIPVQKALPRLLAMVRKELADWQKD